MNRFVPKTPAFRGFDISPLRPHLGLQSTRTKQASYQGFRKYVLDLNIQHLRPEPANRFVQKQVLVEVGSGYGPIDVAADQKKSYTNAESSSSINTAIWGRFRN